MTPRSTRGSGKEGARRQTERRTRRTAEDAKRAILDAAERRLGEHGLDGIRLQQIARDVGVSHPAILHHFGSREGLIQAVVQRAAGSLEAEMIRAIAELPPGQANLVDMIERAHRVFVERGHARVVAWLLLSGHAGGTGATRIRAVAESAHRRRQQPGLDAGGFEDTVFRTLLVALVLFGEAVAGPAMRASAGVGEDEAFERRFRGWLARLLTVPVPEEER